MPSQENARKRQIWLVLLSQNAKIWPVSPSPNGAKLRKINWTWRKSNQFWRWSRFTPCQISGNFSSVCRRKCPKIANSTCFAKSKWLQNEENEQKMAKSNQFWRCMSNVIPFKATAMKIQTRNKLYLWCTHKHRMKSYNRKNAKNKQFWPNPTILSSKSSRGVIMENSMWLQ